MAKEKLGSFKNEVDITNPANQLRVESKHYEEYYANRAELHITSQDARILFQQLKGIVEHNGALRALVEAKTTITMTHAEFRGLCMTMAALVERNPHLFASKPNELGPHNISVDVSQAPELNSTSAKR